MDTTPTPTYVRAMPTHAETRVLPYTPEQLFDLVADIQQYPKFLPWCIGARIRKREPHVRGELVVADLVIGFKMVREKFTSRVVLQADRCIDVEYVEGPLSHLNNHWKFRDHPKGCEVDFYVDFEFRSKMLQRLIGALFNQAFTRMVAAFEARARDLYGPSGLTANAARGSGGSGYVPAAGGPAK